MFERQQEQQVPELLLMRDRPGSIYDFDAVAADELSVRLEPLPPEEKAQELFDALSEAPTDPVDWESSGIKSYGYNPYRHAVGSVFEAAAHDRDTATILAELLEQDAKQPEGFLKTARPEVLEIAFIRAWNVGDAIMRPDATTPTLETFARLLGPHIPLEKLTEILQNRLTETSYRTLSITKPPEPGQRLTATLIEKAAEETKVLNIHAVKRAFSSLPPLMGALEHAGSKAKEQVYIENLRTSYPNLIKPYNSAGQYSQWLKTIDAFMSHELPVDLADTARADDAGQAITYLVSGLSESELLQEAEQRVETFLKALESNNSETISDYAKKKAETVITGLCSKIPVDTDAGQQQFNRIEALVMHLHPERSLERWHSLTRWRHTRNAHLEHVQALAELGVDPNLPHSVAHIEIALPKGRIAYADSDPAINQSNLKLDLAVYLDSLAYRGHDTSSKTEHDLSKLTRNSDIQEAIDQLNEWLERDTRESFKLAFGSGNKILQYTSYRTLIVSRTDQNNFELQAERHERPTQNPTDELETFAAKTNRQVDYDSLPELRVRIRPELEAFNRSRLDMNFPLRTSLPLDFLSKIYQKLARLPEGDITSDSFQDAQEMASSVHNLALTRGHLILEVPHTASSVAEDSGNYTYRHSFQKEGGKQTLYLPLVTVRHKEEIPLTQAEINQAQARFKEYIRLSRGTIETVPKWYTTPKAASITSNFFV